MINTKNEELRQQCKSILARLSEKQETLAKIENQQVAINEKFAAVEVEKRGLADSFKGLMHDLSEIQTEVEALEQKILQQN